KRADQPSESFVVSPDSHRLISGLRNTEVPQVQKEYVGSDQSGAGECLLRSHRAESGAQLGSRRAWACFSASDHQQDNSRAELLSIVGERPFVDIGLSRRNLNDRVRAAQLSNDLVERYKTRFIGEVRTVRLARVDKSKFVRRERRRRTVHCR